MGLIDTNHNVKNTRYQVIGGSSVVWMGGYILDPELLRIAGVENLLWRVKDFASDLLVLKLCSVETLNSLSALHSEDSGAVAILSLTLYFMRMRLYAVNTKVLGFRERISLIWSCTIWMTSFGYQSRLGTNQKNMLANRRNMVTEGIGMIFLIARNDIMNVRYCTTEPCEHWFPGLRVDKREFTVL